MSSLHALPEPIPSVQVGAVLLTVTAARRDEGGITATVHAGNGHATWSDTICLTTNEGRQTWFTQASPRTGLSEKDAEGGLLELGPLVGTALRGLPVVAWEPVIPLGAAAPAMPFPVAALTVPALINFVNAVAASYRVPPDFAAAGVLGALSGAIGHRRALHLGGELYASACLWVAAVGRSGNGRTPRSRPIRRN